MVDDSQSCIDHVFFELEVLSEVRAGVIHTHMTDLCSTTLELLFSDTATDTGADVTVQQRSVLDTDTQL